MSRYKNIPAAVFKSKCLKLLDRVAAGGEPLIVTKRGRPVARVLPIETSRGPSLAGSVTTRGDIVGPLLDEWELDR
jgi:prevent-host-death family protein